MKRVLSLILLMIFGAGFLFSEPLSKIGIINISRIVQAYYAESRSWREIEEETRKVEEYLSEKIAQLNDLRARKLAAQNQGDEQQVLRLDDEIFKLQEHIQEYRNIKYNQIKTQRDRLLQSPDFAAELRRGINFIAENEGYTLILNSDARDIMWWSPEVDITEKVLSYLRSTSRRN